MELISLASGSSGNCYYVHHNEEAILIDAGLSAKQTFLKLAQAKQNPEKIKALFITHEHSDHIRGADVIARALNIPIIGTQHTLHARALTKNPRLLKYMKNTDKEKIGLFTVDAVPKSHTAADPVAFVVRAHTSHEAVAIITDLGIVTSEIAETIAAATCVVIESNHDVQMLDKGSYPHYLKNWIRSEEGHLSNMQAAEAIVQHASKKLHTVMLAHLSQHNNTTLLAEVTMMTHIKKRKDIAPRIIISHRHHTSDTIRME